MVEAQDLTLAYGRQAVASHLSVELEPGSITTFVGPNGCGKSTLLRALARLHRPRLGTVLLDGADIHHLPTREVARKMGYLAQSAEAPEALTVVELVRRGRYPHRGPWEPLGQDDEAAVTGALEACGLAALAHRQVDQLSGGQRQRAWIALTLAQESPLILLDEPTTFLDPPHQAEILSLILSLNRDRGFTFGLVLHDLPQAARISHRIVALKQGTMVRAGTPAQVLTPAVLGDLFGVEFDERGVVPSVGLGRPVLGEGAPTVSARGLVAGYGGVPVVGPCEVNFGPGGFHVVQGPNGSGKSTLLRTLAGLHPRLGGDIALDGVALEKWSNRALAARRAFVRQDTPMPAGFTVNELLELGAYPRRGLWTSRSSQEEAAVRRALVTLDLEGLGALPLEHLSGGQRQRAWLAHAFVQGSPLLFLDEPTSFLDPRHQRDLLDALWTLTRSAPVTVVTILHEPLLARRYADSITDLAGPGATSS